MNSDERHEARYQRRRAHREANKAAREAAVGQMEDVFSFSKMFACGVQCCNGVRWKASTTNFETHLFSGTARKRRAILDGTWKSQPCTRFVLRERGKARVIDAPRIADRQVHKVCARHLLTPLYEPSMIRDNAASRKGKGLHWQFERLKNMLRRHYRKHGRKGAVLLLDLKGFFPNANRKLIFERHKQLVSDPRLRAIVDKVVDTAPRSAPGRGMPLGLELSQTEMTALPTAIDQWLKSQCGIKIAGHYMDDYFVIMPDADKLRAIALQLINKFRAAGIPVNLNKCHIVPLTKPFRFCKARFTLTETGRVIVNGCRDGMKRARRKLKKFRKLVDEGSMNLQQVRDFVQCQAAYYRNYNDHGRLLKLNRLYHALFESEERQ